MVRVFHHHIVEIMQQLIAAIKEKGPGADIDMSDVGQRESFDTIGERRTCCESLGIHMSSAIVFQDMVRPHDNGPGESNDSFPAMYCC